MQSNGAPVSETSGLYCQAFMTTCGAAGNSAKQLAVTSNQQHVKTCPTSHLVTNRAYTASKLTTDYVSEVLPLIPSEICIGTLPHATSESHIRHAVEHNATLQRKDIPHIDSNNAEYVQFINPSSDSRSHSAGTSEKDRTQNESPRLRRNHSGSRIVTATKNDDALYCEINDNDRDESCDDLTLPAVPDNDYSSAAWEDIVAERDKLLQRVSRLTIEKQEIVYKLRSFVETNGRLHVELEHARAEIAELQNKLLENLSTLEREQREKALLNARLVELTSLRTLNSNEQHINREQLPLNKQMSEGGVVNTGNVCRFMQSKIVIKVS